MQHPRTKETLKILGQGTTVAAALEDVIENLRSPFRSKQDGKLRAASQVAVILANGASVLRTLKEFESGSAYLQPAIADPESDLAELF